MEFETDDDAEEDDSGYRPALFCAFGDAKLPNLSAMRLIIRSTSCLLGGKLGRLRERLCEGCERACVVRRGVMWLP